MKMEDFAGTKTLVRLFLRKDRITLPVWIIILVLSAVSTISSYKSLYHTDEALKGVADVINNPAVLAMNGPLYKISLGALTAWKIGTSNLTLVALMSLLTVIRHTRAEEEAGRRELLGSTVVGRNAGLTAALIVAFGANLVLGALTALGLMGTGLAAAGSIAVGLSWAGIGCLFAAAAGVAAQMTEGSGGARGVVGVFLGLVFMLRIIGDAGGEGNSLSWVSWLSPISWGHHMRAFAGEQWWILWLFFGFSVIFAIIAYTLSSRRDIGAGILPQRLGPAEASEGLRSPLALAWRQNWGSLLGWTIGFGIFGLGIGGVAQTASNAVGTNPQFQKMQEVLSKIGGHGAIADTLIAAMFALFSLVASIYAVQSVLRLRSEEEDFLAESMLGTSVSRSRWAASHVIFAILGPALILVVSGLGMGLAYGSGSGEISRQIARTLGGAVVQLPAIWVLTGITMALYGLLPRFSFVSWVALIAFVLLGQFGELLKLSQSVMNISPFTHIPKLPGGEVTAAPLIWLVAIAAVLTYVGFAGFRRRDIG